MGKVALWILASVGALELTEVAQQLWVGQSIYHSSVADPYLREKNFRAIAAIAALIICGGVAATKWVRSRWDYFTWRVGW